MKKFYSSIMMLALIVAALGLTACSSSSDDDEDDEINNKSIIGNWQSVTSQGYDIILKSGERIDNKERPYNNLYMKFYDDGTCMIGDPQIANDGLSCTYTLNGKELIIEVYGMKDRYVIEELTTDKLVVSYKYYGKSSWDEDIEIHVIYTMIRVNKYI